MGERKTGSHYAAHRIALSSLELRGDLPTSVSQMLELRLWWYLRWGSHFTAQASLELKIVFLLSLPSVLIINMSCCLIFN